MCLKVQTTSGNALREQAQQVVIVLLKELGVELFIENVPSSELFARYSSGAFRRHGHFNIIEFSTGYPIYPQRLLEDLYPTSGVPSDENGGGGYNFQRWIDEGIDAMLRVAECSADLEERKAIYRAVSERFAEEVPMIFLYNRSRINGLTEDFMGFEVNVWSSNNWNSQGWWLDR